MLWKDITNEVTEQYKCKCECLLYIVKDTTERREITSKSTRLIRVGDFIKEPLIRVIGSDRIIINNDTITHSLPSVQYFYK
jgi:hypothetical protein